MRKDTQAGAPRRMPASDMCYFYGLGTVRVLYRARRLIVIFFATKMVSEVYYYGNICNDCGLFHFLYDRRVEGCLTIV